MSARQFGIGLLLGFATLLIGVPAHHAATLTGIQWVEASDGTGRASLFLTFEPGVPGMETTVAPGGLTLWFPGSETSAPPMGNIQVEQEDGGVRLQLNLDGVRLSAFRIEESLLTLVLGVPVPELDSPPGEYHLGVGDILSIQVYRAPDLSGEYPIGQDGTVNLPLVGAVEAAGLSESRLADRVLERLRDYLVDPQVSVSIVSYESQFIHVTGDVPRAMRVALRPGKTLKDVLSEAGVALTREQAVTLTTTGPDGAPMSYTLTAAEIDDPSIPLPGDGDVLTVQEPASVYIRGEVQRPGRLEYEPGMTLQQVVTLAEGLTEWASRKEIRILRKDGEQTTEIKANLKKIEAGKEPDPELAPGDLIIVRRRVL